MRYRSRSRLLRRVERQSRNKAILALAGTILIVLAVFQIGIPILVQFSLFIGGLRSGAEEVTQSEPNFIQPPRLNPLPEATNAAKIKIEGVATPEKEVEIFIEDGKVSKTKADKDGKFALASFRLTEGENRIKARLSDGERKSDFSETVIVTYDNKPPLLEVTSPSENQSFPKGEQSIEVKGKTESLAKVTINGSWAIVDGEGNFSYNLTLRTGENSIVVQSTDLASNKTEIARKVTLSP